MENVYIKGTPEEVITAKFMKEVFNLNVTILEDEVSKNPYFIPHNTL